jgi:hypothetical protein
MKAWMILALAPAAFAQQQQDVLIHRSGPMPAVQVFSHMTAPVKGAPYAAEAVTETVQRLADGTRITNSTTTRNYRDSEGRTRTDTTVKALGPWLPEGGGSKQISTIFDPVTNESISLDHESRTAMRNFLKAPAWAGAKPAAGKQAVQVDIEKRVLIHGPGPGPAEGDVLMPGPGVIHFVQEGPVGSPAVMPLEKANVHHKSLGKRMIEGVECEGTLTILTIPEGQIGNDRPIEVTTETWRSPELKIDILRKHNDPRFGETNYRVVNLVRAEQPRSLFEAPAGYEVKELPAAFNIRVAPPKQVK